jgi:hypothetical protein
MRRGGPTVERLYSKKFRAAIVASLDREAHHACSSARIRLLEF